MADSVLCVLECENLKAADGAAPLSCRSSWTTGGRGDALGGKAVEPLHPRLGGGAKVRAQVRGKARKSSEMI